MMEKDLRDSPLVAMVNNPFLSTVAFSSWTFYALLDLIYPYEDIKPENERNIYHKMVKPQKGSIKQDIRYRSRTF